MEPTIVSGTGVICISSDRIKAKIVEALMEKAIMDCHEEGITDPEEIRKRMIRAKEAVR